MSKIKYPRISVKFEDGENAAGIIARTQKALRRAGVLPDVIERYRAEATASDYDNVIETTERWVNTD